MDDVVDIAASLCAIDSTSGNETAVVAHTEALLQSEGWRTERIPVTAGRDTLLATTGAREPVVTLSTHLDTVPPFIPPQVRHAVLHGRGSCDAKGIAASMIVAARELRRRGVPVALLFVVGEETSHDGARAANAWGRERGFRSLALINGEPTENRLAVGTKGAMRFTLRTRGVAAHSAYPELGESATMALARLLVELDALALPTDPLLGATTINVAHLNGGVADNVIPPWAEARCMARLVSDPDELERLLLDWLGGRAELERTVTVPPVRLRTVPGFDTCVAAYATDIPALTAWGTPYLLGPGSIHVAHTEAEQVEIAALRRAAELYVQLAESCAGRPA